jgi:hypothetical protein
VCKSKWSSQERGHTWLVPSQKSKQSVRPVENLRRNQRGFTMSMNRWIGKFKVKGNWQRIHLQWNVRDLAERL